MPAVLDRRRPITDPARVFRGRDLLCFSHDWTGDPLSKTHLMKLLARDNRVLWVNSIGYRAPAATAADLGRAWRKLKAAAAPLMQPPFLALAGPPGHAQAPLPPAGQLGVQSGRRRPGRVARRGACHLLLRG